MTTRQTEHLNDDEFADCLVAEYPQPAIRAHLATCDRCREELGVFMVTMDDFSHAALGWSRARQDVPLSRPARQSFFQPLQWAVACVLALAIGVPVALHVNQDRGAGKSVSSELDDSDAQIAQDNSLMQSVDVALGQNDPSPYQEYQLDEARSRTNTQSRVE